MYRRVLAASVLTVILFVVCSLAFFGCNNQNGKEEGSVVSSVQSSNKKVSADSMSLALEKVLNPNWDSCYVQITKYEDGKKSEIALKYQNGTDTWGRTNRVFMELKENNYQMDGYLYCQENKEYIIGSSHLGDYYAKREIHDVLPNQIYLKQLTEDFTINDIDAKDYEFDSEDGYYKYRDETEQVRLGFQDGELVFYEMTKPNATVQMSFGGFNSTSFDIPMEYKNEESAAIYSYLLRFGVDSVLISKRNVRALCNNIGACLNELIASGTISSTSSAPDVAEALRTYGYEFVMSEDEAVGDSFSVVEGIGDNQTITVYHNNYKVVCAVNYTRATLDIPDAEQFVER